MAFDTFEKSVELGQPTELYEFATGTELFRYTSSQTNVVLTGGITYTAIPIARGKLDVSSIDPSAQRLEIVLPSTNEFIIRYIPSVPGQRATVTLKRLHRNDGAEETVTVFKGTIRNVSFTQNGREAVLQALPLTSALRRTAPRFTYSGLCNHMLYDSRCKIDKDAPAFRLDAEVSDVTGDTITVVGAAVFSGALPDFFVAGYVEFGGDFRAIIAQAGDVLTLTLPFSQSPLGEIVIARAGCKQRIVEDCQNKFNNVVNFGGFPYVPLKNPFETGLD